MDTNWPRFQRNADKFSERSHVLVLKSHFNANLNLFFLCKGTASEACFTLHPFASLKSDYKATTDEVKKDFLLCYMLIRLLHITGLYVGEFSNAEHLNCPKGQRRKEMVCSCCLVLSTLKLVDVCRCARDYNNNLK